MRVTCNAILQVLQNIRSNPEDPRFRRIRSQNEKFHADVGRYDGALQILIASGFQMHAEEKENVLVMTEPDLAVQLDAWTIWYDTLKDTITKLRQETDARSTTSHGGLLT